MTPLRALLLAPALALGLIAAPAPPAAAITLDEARAAGYVGERFDGFVALVDPNAPPEVRALVEQVNAQRRQSYAALAEKRRQEDPNVTVEVVGKLAAQQIMRKVPPGTFIMGPKGEWAQR